MNQKNNLSELSDEKLLKRRDLLKGVLIGMYSICILLIVLLLYIFFVKDFSKISLTTFIPVLMLPVITLPLLFQVNTLNKEIKSRNLE
jgi:tryptophan-rich sensory protein